MSFAHSILGSYTPSVQYFKTTTPASISAYPSSSTNFESYNYSWCGGIHCVAFNVMTTPDSAKGGQVTLFVMYLNSSQPCYTNFVLPLALDTLGNIETNNTSYPVNIPSCNGSQPISLTATVTGDPDSASGYTITIQ